MVCPPKLTEEHGLDGSVRDCADGSEQDERGRGDEDEGRDQQGEPLLELGPPPLERSLSAFAGEEADCEECRERKDEDRETTDATFAADDRRRWAVSIC